MEPTVSNPRAAVNGSSERLTAAEVPGPSALAHPASSSEATAGKASRTRVGLQRVQPGRLARGLAGGTARLQRSAPGRVARAITRRAEGLWRRHPLEATTLTLMALAGLAYPVPFWWLDFAVWLIGAGVAVPSQLWDLRDKWGALAGPVAVVVAGTAIMLAAGGTRAAMTDYVHEALAGSLYLIKGGSLAGAAYLAWRVHRGRRTPPPPPWRRPPRR